MKNKFNRSLLIVAALIGTSLLLAACGPSANPDGTINVNVTLTDFGIESSLTEFESGKTYRFTITNEGAIPHEFVIAEPLDAHSDDEHSDDSEMMHEGLIVEVGEDKLPPGATVVIDVTFPDHIDGEVEFACHTPGHYEAGMHSPLTVK
ncbi:MAG: plastocyanin/azurin family copper-binding protein [Anaerolineales bacterium]